MTQRVSKLDASRLLGISPTTIDRRIQRGELQVEMEQRGTRFRTWVILGDDVSSGRSPDPPDERPDERPREHSGERPPEQSAVEVRVLEERVHSLEQLADYHQQQLKDADWRYQELVQPLLWPSSDASQEWSNSCESLLLGGLAHCPRLLPEVQDGLLLAAVKRRWRSRQCCFQLSPWLPPPQSPDKLPSSSRPSLPTGDWWSPPALPLP